MNNWAFSFALPLVPFAPSSSVQLAAGAVGEASQATKGAAPGGVAAMRWRVKFDGWRVCFEVLDAVIGCGRAVTETQLDCAAAVRCRTDCKRAGQE